MHYFYDPTPRDKELERRLWEYVETLPLDENGLKAYVERGRTFPGVGIRRITNYEEDLRAKIRRDADDIYRDVMGLRKKEE